MSGMEDKILGKEKKSIENLKTQDALTARAVWKITRTGCGVMLTNGVMTAQMLSAESKAQALKGVSKITEENCIYERVK